MTLPSCIAQASLSLALAASPFTLHTTAQGAPPQAAIGPRSWLGVGIVDLTPEKASQLNLGEVHGVEIAQVAEGGPAQDAGLTDGDVITRFRNEVVRGAEHFARLVRETPHGRTVELEIWRDGKQRSVDVVVETRSLPSAMDIAAHFKRKATSTGFDFPRAVTVVRNRSIGLEMEAIDGQFAKFFGVQRGVLVRSVVAGSAAAESGFVAGDVIVSIAGHAVQDPADIRRELDDSAASVEIGIVRHRRSSKVRLIRDESSGGAWPLTGHN